MIEAVAVDPSANTIYVGYASAGAVTVIDGATNAIIDSSVPLGLDYPIDRLTAAAANGIAIDTATHTIFVADGELTILNSSSTVPITQIPNGAGIGVAFNPVTGIIYGTNYNTDTVSVITGPPPSGPLISGLDPRAGPPTGNTSVTITGSGFTGATAVSFGGTLATSYTIDADSQITATSPAHPAGTVDVTVTTNNGSGAGGAADRFTYLNATGPTITSLQPTSTVTNSGAQYITVNGAGFVNGDTILWNGSSLTTNYVSSTQVVAQISEFDDSFAVPGTDYISVSTPGGAVSNQLPFTVTLPSPQPDSRPAITSVEPATIPANSNATQITITGKNFDNDAVVFWNGADLSSTVVNSTTIKASISASDLTTPGGQYLFVWDQNESNTEGYSNQYVVMVTASGALKLQQPQKHDALSDAGITSTELGMDLSGEAIGAFIGSFIGPEGTLVGLGVGGAIANGAGCYLFASPDGSGKWATCVAKGLPGVDIASQITDAYSIGADLKAANDPPDSNYTVIAQPIVPDVPQLVAGAVLSQPLADAFNDLFANRAERAAVLIAMTHSVERSEGAAIAGDVGWEARQQQQARDFATQLATLDSQRPGLISTLQAALIQDGIPTVFIGSDIWSQVRTEISSNGLPSGMVDELKSAGADNATIAQVKNLVLSFNMNNSLSEASLGQQEAHDVGNLGLSEPPTTTATVSPSSPSASGWYTSTPKLTLSVQDHSGSEQPPKTYYALDVAAGTSLEMSDTTQYTVPIAIPDGKHTIIYFSIDGTGNVEPSQHLTLQVDTQAPVIASPAANRQYVLGQTMPLKCSDGTGSGVANCQVTVTLPNGSKQPVSQGDNFPTTQLGTYTVAPTNVTDVAGNRDSTTFTYAVGYDVVTLPGSSQTVTRGYYALIRIVPEDAQGHDLANRTLVVKAMEFDGSNGQTISFDYRFQFGRFNGAQGYQLEMNTRSLTPGTWTLKLTIGSDTQLVYPVTFTVRS